MELGQRLKQARLEAGLSQRQLCGDLITRNMLSLIENGSAQPSMDTLRVLSARLGKPMGYFLEEQAVTSPNQAIMTQARDAAPNEVLTLLGEYQSPDPVFDRERWLLEALACMALGQTAIDEGRTGYARSLLARAADAGKKTPYYTPETERRRVLLCRLAGVPAEGLEPLLPSADAEFLLRAEAALHQKNYGRCAHLLACCTEKSGGWHELYAEALFAQEDYAAAAEHYRLCPETPRICARLEVCYRELEDYKMAYFYACKQKQ